MSVPYFRRENFTGQSINSGGWTQVIFSTGTDIDHSDGRMDAAGVDPDDTQILQAGRYATRGEIKWSPVFAGNTWLRIAGGLFTYYKAVMYAEPGGAAGSDESSVMVYMEYDYPGGTTTLNLHCRQDSGAAQTLDGALMETAYVGDYVGQPADPDTF